MGDAGEPAGGEAGGGAAGELAALRAERDALRAHVRSLEEQLAEAAGQTQRATTLLNTMPVVLVETALNGDVLFISKHWEKMMAISDSAVALGRGFLGYIHEEDRDAVLARFQAFLDSGEPYGHFGVWRQWKAGRKECIYIEGSGVINKGPDGSPTGYLCTLVDVTAIKQAELRVNQALVEAQAANVAKAVFTANVSHEIRTPLHGVLGFLQLLEDTPLTEEQSGLVAAIRDCSEGLNALVSDVLDLAKIDAGQQSVVESPFDFHGWLWSLLYVWGVKAAQKNITIRLDIGGTSLPTDQLLDLPGPPPQSRYAPSSPQLAGPALNGHPPGGAGRSPSPLPGAKCLRHPGMRSLPAILKGDDAKLKQIVGNFLANALKFTEPGGAVTLAIALDPLHPARGPRADVLRVAVSDTGCGIPSDSEAQSKLFRAFSQLDTGIQRRFGGTGLGLAISKSLAELMGGEIGFESDGVGRGSRFWVSVPVERGDEAGEVHGAPKPREAPAGSLKEFAGLAAEHPTRILVAEDNALNQQLLLRLLTKLGYDPEADVVVASNGQEALQRFVAVNGLISQASQSHNALGPGSPRPFKLILMDLSMPILDGIECTRLIRQLPLAPHCVPRIVALTANVQSTDREKCTEAGMDGFLGKPLRVGDLVETIKSMG
ncbi:hypothetical protein DFJ74DRAFT_430446 [Hyaloraphidium curvatum]|nr:hypothetical protein DFJ74DRAFT_430446 [Hyaloraphidium curvatum]